MVFTAEKFFFSGVGDIPGGPGYIAVFSGGNYIDRDGDGIADYVTTPKYIMELPNGSIICCGDRLDNSSGNNTTWPQYQTCAKISSNLSTKEIFGNKRSNAGYNNNWEMGYNGTYIGNSVIVGKSSYRGVGNPASNAVSYNCSSTPTRTAAKTLDLGSTSQVEDWCYDKSNPSNYCFSITHTTDNTTGNLLTKFDSSLNVQWQKYMNLYRDLYKPYKISTNSSGDICIGGAWGNSIPSGGSPFRPFVAKYNSSGTGYWQANTEIAGGSSSARCSALLLHSSGDVYAIHRNNSPTNNTFVKYNGTNGNISWAYDLGVVSYYDSIAEDANGDIILGYQTPSSYGIGGKMIVKVDDSGNEIWARIIKPTNSSIGFKIDMTSNDDIFIHFGSSVAMRFDNTLGIPTTQSLGGTSNKIYFATNVFSTAPTMTNSLTNYSFSSNSTTWSNTSNLSSLSTVSTSHMNTYSF